MLLGEWEEVTEVVPKTVCMMSCAGDISFYLHVCPVLEITYDLRNVLINRHVLTKMRLGIFLHKTRQCSTTTDK